jgi:dipeptidase E
MKLIFYSGGGALENKALDQALFKLVGTNKIKMTFIPASAYWGDQDFIEFVEQYSHFGVTKFINFPVDLPFDKVIKKEALSSDVIHLGGGNTFHFLKTLRDSGILKELEKFVKRGGILTGLSAGSIMMTQTIEMAGWPPFDCDDNHDNLKNLKSLGFVPFEFFPHYKNSARYREALMEYSKKKDHPIYACPDGSGIVIHDSQMSFVGKVYGFFHGKKIRLKL